MYTCSTNPLLLNSDGAISDASIQCAYRRIQPTSSSAREAGVCGLGSAAAVHPPVPVSIQHGHMDRAARVFHGHLRGSDDQTPGPQHRRCSGRICDRRTISGRVTLPPGNGAVLVRQSAGSACRRYNIAVLVWFIVSVCIYVCMYVWPGLYGKNAMMSHCCAVSLKSIMAIDPNIGDVLVPFFLSSLDVAAVNQSHQGMYSSRSVVQTLSS